MRRLVSIALLMVFLFFQGGRILLYLECRFSNSITTTSCDCVQILAGSNSANTTDVLPVNSHAGHKHLPEEFEGQPVPLVADITKTNITKAATGIHFTASGYPRSIFHPPPAV